MSTVDNDQVTLQLQDRLYRVRGLGRNTTFERLKVNLFVRSSSDVHVDVLDLYSARQRQAFIKAASMEMDVDPETVKEDLGKLLVHLEEIQEERIAEALKPKDEVPKMSPSEEDAALDLLRDPNLLDRVVEDFERCGLVGEKTNKLAAFVAATSRLLHDPLAVVVQSSSSAGKSTLMDAVLSFIPPEQRLRYSAMSGQAVYYLGNVDLRHKILALVEEEGARRASYALKLLQSEKELVMAVPSKDGQGRTATSEYRVEGPVMLFLTTTAIDVDAELMNRCLVLSVSEDPEQTKAIQKLQRKRETLEGLRLDVEREQIKVLHRNAQRLLRPIRVVNPYAESLSFTSDRTRTRRDHAKYLALIRAIALVHQHQRKLKTTKIGPDEIEYIEVEPQDVERANALMSDLIGAALDDLAPQTRCLLLGIDGLVKAQAEERDIRRSRVRLTRREIREATKMTYDQLRLHLKRLVELEYLVVERGAPGRPHSYRLVAEAGIDAGDLDLKSPDVRVEAVPDLGTRVGSSKSDHSPRSSNDLDGNPGTIVDHAHARAGANGSAD